MNHQINCISAIVIVTFLLSACNPVSEATPIDRKSLVERHHISFNTFDSLNIPQVGNGEIAFGIDPTGLQTLYGNSFSQWGWHSSPLPKGKSMGDFKMTEVQVHGHTASYPVSLEGQEELYWWLRKNPHRLNLGKLAFILDGALVDSADMTEISQNLNLWQGVIYSNYKLKGIDVQVVSTCHPENDALAVRVNSPLIQENRLAIQISFPYGHPTHLSGANWNSPEKHVTELSLTERGAQFTRQLDEDRYSVQLNWDMEATLVPTNPHTYNLTPGGESQSFSFTWYFAPQAGSDPGMAFESTLKASKKQWEEFWTSGGAIDLSGSKDPRWHELERRIVLSQYLMAVNEAGSLPPQESGLLLNSGWYGKFHLEMHWWHGAHYQLWDRWDLFDRSLNWYGEILPEAREIANRQGYEGARWPKMIGPDGRFGPSKIGPWLIWQQPHPIFYAEQNYREDPSPQTLEKWKDVVFESAEFMASYAYKNKNTGYYDLGPWVINAAENNSSTKSSTLNPAFELVYWKYGLSIACQWLERLELPANEQWQSVLENLAPLPVEEGVYVMYEGVPDMWTRFNRSHIDVIGTGAFLPSAGVDLATLSATIDKVWTEWNMESTWGWDLPWLAMAAARAGQPDKALEALLMDSPKNRYSKCGINGGGPAAAYFPGNGGLLYAVAMMAAGWDEGPEEPSPGFPDNGLWEVKYEGLKKAQ